eukprot:8365858-Alexandrium_andersonii.AAC.1
MADCGLRRIAALTGRGRTADCTTGTLQCKDASPLGRVPPKDAGVCRTRIPKAQWFQSARIGRVCRLCAYADWACCGLNLQCGLKAAIGRACWIVGGPRSLSVAVPDRV